MTAEDEEDDILNTYLQVVRFLLQTYATKVVIQESYSEMIRFSQRSGVAELDFAMRFWKLATRCGNVFRPSRLKEMYAAGVSDSSQLRNY